MAVGGDHVDCPALSRKHVRRSRRAPRPRLPHPRTKEIRADIQLTRELRETCPLAWCSTTRRTALNLNSGLNPRRKRFALTLHHLRAEYQR